MMHWSTYKKVKKARKAERARNNPSAAQEPAQPATDPLEEAKRIRDHIRFELYPRYVELGGPRYLAKMQMELDAKLNQWHRKNLMKTWRIGGTKVLASVSSYQTVMTKTDEHGRTRSWVGYRSAKFQKPRNNTVWKAPRVVRKDRVSMVIKYQVRSPTRGRIKGDRTNPKMDYNTMYKFEGSFYMHGIPYDAHGKIDSPYVSRLHTLEEDMDISELTSDTPDLEKVQRLQQWFEETIDRLQKGPIHTDIVYEWEPEDEAMINAKKWEIDRGLK